jgi:hypothetical protein
MVFAQVRRLVGRRRMFVTGQRMNHLSNWQGLRSGGPPPLQAVIGERELSLFDILNLFLTAFLSRPPSPSKRRAASSTMSPVVSMLAAPSESWGRGSAKGQGALGLSGVPKFVKPKKYVLKQSSQ